MAGKGTSRERTADDIIRYVAAQVAANHGRPLTDAQEAEARAWARSGSGRAGPARSTALNSFNYITMLAMRDSVVNHVKGQLYGKD